MAGSLAWAYEWVRSWRAVSASLARLEQHHVRGEGGSRPAVLRHPIARDPARGPHPALHAVRSSLIKSGVLLYPKPSPNPNSSPAPAPTPSLTPTPTPTQPLHAVRSSLIESGVLLYLHTACGGAAWGLFESVRCVGSIENELLVPAHMSHPVIPQSGISA